MLPAVPNRASDGGQPESREPKDWRDYLDDAGDEICKAERLSHDDMAIERRRRLAAIDAAIFSLQAAKELVPRPSISPKEWGL